MSSYFSSQRFSFAASYAPPSRYNYYPTTQLPPPMRLANQVYFGLHLPRIANDPFQPTIEWARKQLIKDQKGHYYTVNGVPSNSNTPEAAEFFKDMKAKRKAAEDAKAAQIAAQMSPAATVTSLPSINGHTVKHDEEETLFLTNAAAEEAIEPPLSDGTTADQVDDLFGENSSGDTLDVAALNTLLGAAYPNVVTAPAGSAGDVDDEVLALQVNQSFENTNCTGTTQSMPTQKSAVQLKKEEENAEKLARRNKALRAKKNFSLPQPLAAAAAEEENTTAPSDAKAQKYLEDSRLALYANTKRRVTVAAAQLPTPDNSSADASPATSSRLRSANSDVATAGSVGRWSTSTKRKRVGDDDERSLGEIKKPDLKTSRVELDLQNVNGDDTTAVSARSSSACKRKRIMVDDEEDEEDVPASKKVHTETGSEDLHHTVTDEPTAPGAGTTVAVEETRGGEKTAGKQDDSDDLHSTSGAGAKTTPIDLSPYSVYDMFNEQELKDAITRVKGKLGALGVDVASTDDLQGMAGDAGTTPGNDSVVAKEGEKLKRQVKAATGTKRGGHRKTLAARIDLNTAGGNGAPTQSSTGSSRKRGRNDDDGDRDGGLAKKRKGRA